MGLVYQPFRGGFGRRRVGPTKVVEPLGRPPREGWGLQQDGRISAVLVFCSGSWAGRRSQETPEKWEGLKKGWAFGYVWASVLPKETEVHLHDPLS